VSVGGDDRLIMALPTGRILGEVMPLLRRLDIGHCHLAVAALASATAPGADESADVAQRSHIRVATTYPEIARRHFAARGVQAECIKLNGAIELAPRLGLCRHIVDLVQTGATLQANGLLEIERIAEVSARLIVNRPAMKTRPQEIGAWIERFRAAVGANPRAGMPPSTVSRTVG